MAYGVVATAALLSVGVTPVVASGAVHVAKVFTGAASGASHWRMGNVDRAVFRALMIPGLLGGAAGAWVLASVPAMIVRPFVSAYLLVMALLILLKAARPKPSIQGAPRAFSLLAFTGAALDAFGGGGWGPIVTSTMIGWGVPPRMAIGTSNAVEFFVALVIAAILFPANMGDVWRIVLGLVVGGVIAAPIAALITTRIPVRGLMAIVGCVIMILSLRALYQDLGAMSFLAP